MTRNELNLKLAAILDTLSEFPDGTPESTIYLVLAMNIDNYNMIKNILLSARLVTIKNHLIKITKSGIELVQKLRSICKEKEPCPASCP